MSEPLDEPFGVVLTNERADDEPKSRNRRPYAPDQIKVTDNRQAAALFFIAPMIAVSIAPPAPPAIN